MSMTRSRSYDAVQTAACKWLRTRGNGQRRLDMVSTIASGTRHRSWPVSRHRVLTAGATSQHRLLPVGSRRLLAPSTTATDACGPLAGASGSPPLRGSRLKADGCFSGRPTEARLVPNGVEKRPSVGRFETADQRTSPASRTWLEAAAGAGRGGSRRRMDLELPVEAPNWALARACRQGRQRAVGPVMQACRQLGDKGMAGFLVAC